MYRIKIFCTFSTSKNCKETYEKINYSNLIDFYGKDNKVYFTDDDDYTHAIIINTIMPELTIPKENVIGLAFEPLAFLDLTDKFIDYAVKNIGKYYIGDKNKLLDPFVEHFGYMWHTRPPKEIISKSNIMSIIVTSKRCAPGHIYRHTLIEKIIQLKLPIDIYGHGSKNYSYNRTKGSFSNNEPYENYLYSICIENYQCNHYFSEKIITPLLHNCMPIYFGCKNINSYFDDTINLTGDVNKDIKLIIKILLKPGQYYKPTYNEKNLKTVNLIENIEKLFLIS